jgi:hypothetical protein
MLPCHATCPRPLQDTIRVLVHDKEPEKVGDYLSRHKLEAVNAYTAKRNDLAKAHYVSARPCLRAARYAHNLQCHADHEPPGRPMPVSAILLASLASFGGEGRMRTRFDIGTNTHASIPVPQVKYLPYLP